jgi:FKBP-type peptidyl-prolyl cis-trans isomerase SlyD
MTEDMLVVEDDLVVSLDYTLRLESGQVIDSSDDGEPLEFLQGHDEIVPGLEKALYGMAIGGEREVVVEAGEGYGDWDPEALQELPLNAFPPDMTLEEGMGLELVDDAGESMLAFVSEVGPESVVLDLNHPLAGETLYFNIKIAGLRQATREELSHGHAHSSGFED